MPILRDLPPSGATLVEVLGNMSADDLRTLLDLLPRERPRPTRKADMAQSIERRLASDSLRKLWDRLHRTQRQAVSEALHGPDGEFVAARFQAKYGVIPKGFRGEFSYGSGKSLLGLFLYGYDRDRGRAIIPADLAERLRAFVPPPPPLTLAAHDELPETVAQPRPGLLRQASAARRSGAPDAP